VIMAESGGMHVATARSVRWLATGAIVLGVAGISRRSAPHDVRAAVHIEPRSAAELAMVRGLSDDVWSEDVEVLSPAGLDRLRALGVPHRVIIDDIDAIADDERRRLANRAQLADWFAEYRDVDEVDAYLQRLSDQHADVARLRSIGASLEGRPIHALAIGHGSIHVVLDGGHHAREWLSVMVPTCIADRLASGDRRMLDAVTFDIVPLVNPDGYHYSWTVDRYWRKNRRGDHGVDLNRNYSVAWGGAGSSGDKRSPDYRGEAAFSEPETRAMRALFESVTVAAHVDFHTYSQVIVYPWSHQRTPPPDRDKLAAIADRMSSAMYAAHGQRYAIRPGSELTVGSSGTAGDWSYGEHGALSFLVELRPASSDDGGFVLPPEQIRPACDEGMAAVVELASWLVDMRVESTGAR
jgi:carboxypeptidase T